MGSEAEMGVGMGVGMGTGTRSVRVVASDEPAKLARVVMRELWGWETGRRGRLVRYRQDWWEYGDGLWHKRLGPLVRAAVWGFLEDLEVLTQDGSKRLRPSKSTVDAVLDAMEAFCALPVSQAPVWLDGSDWDVTECVGFRNAVVNVRTGEVRTRDQTWFDPGSVVVDYVPDAECPVWLEKVEEWSRGREDWKRLHRRIFGYAILNHRKYAIAPLLYGDPRSGKGTNTHVMGKLLGPTAYVEKEMAVLSGQYGWAGTEGAKVLAITEAEELDTFKGERVATGLKIVLGRGRITIDGKWKIPEEVVLNAMPVLCCNGLPNLPDRSQGLSVKLRALPFTVSFVGKEDFGLWEKLERELEGIGAWALRAAMELEAEPDPVRKFEMPEEGKWEIQRFVTMGNPANAFLEEVFVQNATGVVDKQLVWSLYCRWASKHRMQPMQQPKFWVWLWGRSSWPIRETRLGNARRMVRGISPKPDAMVDLYRQPEPEAGAGPEPEPETEVGVGPESETEPETEPDWGK